MVIEIFREPKKFNQKEIELKGWVETFRNNKKIGFIELNDGSSVKNIQLVIKSENENFHLLEQITIGSSLIVKGIIKYTPNMQQEVELEVVELQILKLAQEDYPIQKQLMNLETLREIPHVRHRTKYLRSIMLIRSTLAQNIHQYFSSKGFINVHSPIITSNDGEGAGETFKVSSGTIDNFFGNKKATLGVTGQLHAESYALGFSKVYTFAPTFRAENSNTKKHLAEFWMMEPEMAFFNLDETIALADDMLKNVIKTTLKDRKFEFEYLDQKVEGKLLQKINWYLEHDLVKLEYASAIEILKQNANRFENNNLYFGVDLATEHERFICEEVIKGPVAIINYPKQIKAFYMHQNTDNKTVAAFDLLVPGIGEMIGGSQRECDYNKLLTRINELGMNKEDLDWYLNLRRWGDAQSSGFGLGFERLVMYITGAENIRDAIPYPRTVNNLRM